MGTNLQSRVPPLAERGTQGLHDQITEDTRTTGEVNLHHHEEEKERHIEKGTTKATDRPAMTAAAEVVIVAVIKVEAAAREGIDHRTMEAHPVEK